MSKKIKILWGLLAIVIIIANVLLFNWHSYKIPTVSLTMKVSSDVSDDVQVFYSDHADSWVENQSSRTAYNGSEREDQEMTFHFGAYQSYIRVDLGSKAGIWRLSDLTMLNSDSMFGGHEAVSVPTEVLAEVIDDNDLTALKVEGETLIVETKGGDPYFVAAMPVNAVMQAVRTWEDRMTLVIKILAFLLLDGAALALVVFRKKIMTLPLELMQNRKLIFKLAVNDFKTRFAGSYLGIFWAFVQPVVTILVYWFVFSVGFRSGAVMNVPFVVYLVSGLVPWFYIQEFLNSGTNSLIEYSYLVKKVVFKISVLPMVKAISALFVHAFFIFVTVLITCLYRINPGIHVIQVVYYFLAMFVFSLGIVYGTSAIVIFFRDLSQIINIVLQVGVWTIPIMWDINMIPMKYQWIFKINPMYYVVNGYRESIYGHTWFWHNMGQTVYFWTVTLILFVIGTVIFKRLKVHFADVL